MLLVGAHYDTWRATPGADDNASAIAVLLHLLNELRDDPAAKAGRVRFALYADEEPPYFQTRDMGSLHHARRCKARGWDVEMLCLESLGFHSNAPGSQDDATGGLLGTVGDFLVLEADEASAGLLSRLRAGYAAGPGRPETLDYPRLAAVAKRLAAAARGASQEGL